MPSPASSVPVVPPVAQRRKRSRAKWYLIGTIVLLGAAGTAFHYVRRGKAEVIAVTTDKAVVKTITQLVTATGKVQPETEVKISPQVSGEIVQLPFREGASVKKGDLLVAIKPDVYRFGVEQAQASLIAAKASADDCKARMVQAEADFKRSEDLHTKNLVSDADFSTARTTFESAQATYANAVANITHAEGAVSQAQDQLNQTTMYSPIDGKISLLNNEVGETVASTGQYGGAEVLRVADLDNMEIRVKVNENDIVNVKVGDRASIAIDAFPGRHFNGTVTEISNSATAGATTTGTDDVTNFQVKIRITDRGLALRPGMSATADIETQTVENVVAVPIQSVTVRAGGGMTTEEMQQQKAKAAKEKTGNDLDVATERGQARRERDALQRVIFLKEGDTVKMKAVETGIADNTYIEVKSGVKAGDEVVSGSYAAISRKLKDGAKVVIEKPNPQDKK
jgi:HlyD family secretion protein